MTLLIDDQKVIKADIIARTYNSGIEELKKRKIDCLLLDNDLGSGPAESGMQILRWFEDNHDYRPNKIIFVTATEEIKDMLGEFAMLAGYKKIDKDTYTLTEEV